VCGPAELDQGAPLADGRLVQRSGLLWFVELDWPRLDIRQFQVANGLRVTGEGCSRIASRLTTPRAGMGSEITAGHHPNARA
jgi:hypothetical protein